MAYIRQRGDRWYACWTDTAGKQKSKACGKGSTGKATAEQVSETMQAKLTLGIYEEDSKPKTWKDFCDLYADKKLSRLRGSSQSAASADIKNFERIANPATVQQIDEMLIDEYISIRSREPGRKGDSISPATVNKELRTVRAMLNAARRWKIIRDVPEIEFLRCDQEEPEFISSAEFSKLYHACRQSSLPEPMLNVSAEDAWKGLLVFIYMTGWRISQTLALEWGDLDTDSGLIFSPASRNKGRRDVSCQLHPIVLEHLGPLQASFANHIFFAPDCSKKLYPEFHRIQRIAGIKPNHRDCYGFHDLRRGFASENAASLDLFELQQLMQHRTLSTTKKYAAMGHRHDSSSKKLHVPDLSEKGKHA